MDKSRNKRGFVLKSASHVQNSRNVTAPKGLNKSYGLPPIGFQNNSFLDRLSSGGGGTQMRQDY